MLFQAEGITFSKFVLGQRLMRAHRMLSDRRFVGLSITTIAFGAGFGDLVFQSQLPPPLWRDPSELRNSPREVEPPSDPRDAQPVV
jgi:transcriptional regulator GlxA family with amidase domain